LGVADRVYFAGERTDIPAIMGALDILLVPSWSEPFGIVMIEAMAAGTPVIATQEGGPADVIRSGRDGVLVPPRQPPALAEEFAWRSAAYVSLALHHGGPTMWSRCCSLYFRRHPSIPRFITRIQ